MGRKAKLKKQRQQAKLNPPIDDSTHEIEPNSTACVQNLEKEGYRLTDVQNCPEIPDNSVKPQL